MSGIFSLISTPYVKQQTNILWCFSSLKFENSFLAISFSDLYFAVRGRFIQLKTTKKSILFKTSSLKSHFSLCKLLLDFATTAISYFSSSLWSLSKDFFTIQETAGSSFLLDYERPPHQIEYIL